MRMFILFQWKRQWNVIWFGSGSLISTVKQYWVLISIIKFCISQRFVSGKTRAASICVAHCLVWAVCAWCPTLLPDGAQEGLWWGKLLFRYFVVVWALLCCIKQSHKILSSCSVLGQICLFHTIVENGCKSTVRNHWEERGYAWNF